MSLFYIAQQLTIYGGFILLSAGVTGNSLNILIFLAEKNYRQIPSTFFFLIASIINSMHLIFNLGLRILSVGYGIDLTIKSLVICKARMTSLTAFGLISFTCICLASIDQYLTTSRHQSIRKYSNIKWAHRVLFVMIIIWLAYCIPYWIFYDIVNGICINTNQTLINHGIYSYFILLFGLPLLVLIVFEYLSYRNIHRIRALTNQQADRQLTRMTLIQTILVCLSIIPYGIMNIYGIVANGISKNIDQQMKEYFLASIASLISYLHFSSSFYIFCIASKRFRRAFLNRVLFWKRSIEIVPSNVI